MGLNLIKKLELSNINLSTGKGSETEQNPPELSGQ